MTRQIQTKLADTVIEGATGYVLDIRDMGAFEIQVDAVIISTAKVVASGNITAAGVFVSAGHGLYTGLKGQFTTSSALPTGLALATDYYIIVLTTDTFTVASSLANALALPPVGVTITSAGVGNQTFTPVAVSAGSYKLQKSSNYSMPTHSYDGSADGIGTFIDLVAGETNSVVTNTISATGVSSASCKQMYAAFGKILFALSAGSIKIIVWGSAKAL